MKTKIKKHIIEDIEIIISILAFTYFIIFLLLLLVEISVNNKITILAFTFFTAIFILLVGVLIFLNLKFTIKIQTKKSLKNEF